MKTFLTKAGKKKIEDELHELRGPEMRSLLEALSEARDKGDLSENAEYDSAKDALNMLHIRISKLEDTLANSTLIQKPLDISKVDILTTVTVKEGKSTKTFTIVPENEIDFKAGKISLNSPIGKGLMGKQIGDKTKITVPNGVIEYKIVDIK